MAVRRGADCGCLFCNHPIVKMLAEFYFLVWGIIGLLFLVGMIWGMVKFKTWEQKGIFEPWAGMTQSQNQTPVNRYR